MKIENDIATFITAGGESTRMGTNKGLMEIAGKPMVIHLADMLSENGISFKIIANRQEYGILKSDVVKDVVPEKGPMGALLTAFHYAGRKDVLLLGCDTPFFPFLAFNRLIKNARQKAITAAFFSGRINPLQAIYSYGFKDIVEQRIENNQLRMLDLIRICDHRIVDMTDIERQFPEYFINFNEPKDILKWKTNYMEAG